MVSMAVMLMMVSMAVMLITVSMARQQQQHWHAMMGED
jgi:hypothetical protein